MVGPIVTIYNILDTLHVQRAKWDPTSTPSHNAGRNLNFKISIKTIVSSQKYLYRILLLQRLLLCLQVRKQTGILLQQIA